MLMIPHKHSVHPPFLLGGGEGGVSLLPNFQKEGGGGGLDRTSTCRGG